jgi:hypothetical protein
MQDAAQKYGIDVAGLWDKFQGARMHASFQTLWDDWKLLTDGGADANAVLDGMSGTINSLVLDSMKFGVQIPSNFKPLIEQLFNAGKLTDDNKQKMLTLAGISWDDKPIESSFEILIGKLDKLIDRLTTGLPNAIDAVNRKRVVVGVDDPDLGGRGDGSGFNQAHSGGYLWSGRVYHGGGQVRDEFPILAQSGEFVMRRSAVNFHGVDFMREVNRGAGGRLGAGDSFRPVFNVYVGARQFDDVVIESIDRKYRQRYRVGAGA